MKADDIAGCAPRPAVAASFDRAARTYRAHAGVQRAMATWLAAWLPAERTGRALEIGAGPGGFTRRLLPWAGELVATDISSAMCAAGRAAVPQIDWRVMAAEGVEGGPWDWIFCASMLQWAETPLEVFANWRRQLATQGRILAGIFTAGSLPELRTALDDDGPVTWRSVDAWRTHLRDGGFEVVRDEAVVRTFYYPDAIALLRSLHGVGAAPERRMAPARLRRLLHDYDARYRSSDGVPATWEFYRCEARRR